MSGLAQDFALDHRSLKLFRVLLGSLVLVDLIERSLHLENYIAGGLAPLGIYELPHATFSFYYFNESLEFQIFLFLITILLAILFSTGRLLSVVTPLLWVMVLSLNNRNLIITSGADHLMTALLFWSCFLPLSAKSQKSPQVLSIGSIGISIFLIQFYVLSGWMKFLSPDWQQGLGVYYALSMYEYSTSLGELIRQMPLWVLKALNWGTLVLESFAPLLLFVPWRSSYFRLFLIITFSSFHLGLALCFHLWLFPWVSIAMWSLMIPSSFWNRWQLSKEGGVSLEWRGIQQLLAAFVTGYTILIFITHIFTVSDSFKESVQSVPTLLFMGQPSGYFSSLKYNSIWYHLTAEFSDGSTRDLIEEERDSLGRPIKSSAFYQFRNRDHIQSFLEPNDPLLPTFLDYWCRQYQNTSVKLERLKLIQGTQSTLSQDAPVHQQVLLDKQCSKVL